MLASGQYYNRKVVRGMIYADLISTGDKSALLAVENHQFSMYSAPSRGLCALFRKSDCFECLSPHEAAV